MTEEQKYHKILLEYKQYAVSMQFYELASYIRDIETENFKVIRTYLKETTPHTFSNYRGFDKNRLVKSLQELPTGIVSNSIKRDINLKRILGELF